MDKFAPFCEKSKFFTLMYELDICVPLLSGGYGIAQALKYNKKRASIQTSDIDLHLNLIDPTPTAMKQIDKVVKTFLTMFTSFSKLKEPQLKVRKFSKSLDQVMVPGLLNVKVHRLYFVTYKDKPLFDIAITTESPYQLDIQALRATGLPIKTLKAYTLEVYSMILRESVLGLNNRAYKQRNPIKGKMKEKGVKNFKRLQKLCEKSTDGYCKITPGSKLKNAAALSTYLRVLTS